MKIEKKEMIMCKCSTDAVMVELDEEENCIYLSLWGMGVGDRKDCGFGKFVFALKMFFNYLRYGDLGCDQIVLEKVEAKRLKDRLAKCITKLKEEKNEESKEDEKA